VALAAQKNYRGHQCFNLLLNWFIDGKLLIAMGSSFQISLRLYLVLLLKIFHSKLKTTKLSLESCCPASKFSSDCYGDQPVFMYVICAGPTNCCSFQ